MTHRFHESILREYDVRGVFQETLRPEDAFFIGRCYAALLPQKKCKVAVAWDGRTSSPQLKEKLIEGLLASGVDVIEVGMGPTPLLYFSVHHLALDGGIMVTGSHNPKNHNGFKMMLKDRAVLGDEIRSFQSLVQHLLSPESRGKRQAQDLVGAYIQRLLQDLKLQTPLKVVWDAGNGAAGELVTALAKQIEGQHAFLFCDIDGTFPNHHPDPSKEENLADLTAKVLQEKADVGFAFDGDGDRLGVVDETGTSLPVDQLIMFLARDVLEAHPGGTIIADVKASQALFEDVAARGGKPLMWKTGHSIIKSKMKALKAPFAGEVSGHIFFNDHYFGYDDALYTAVRFLNILSALKKPLSTIRQSLPAYATSPEFRFPCADDKKFGVVQNVKAALLKEGVEKFSDIDGLRVEYEDGWWLLRASNTQDVLVYRAEGKDTAALKRIHASAQKYLGPLGLEINPS